MNRSLTILEMCLIGGLLLNFGGLVWAAATLNATVGQIQTALTSATGAIEQLKAGASDLNVVKYRLGKLEEDYSALRSDVRQNTERIKNR